MSTWIFHVIFQTREKRRLPKAEEQEPKAGVKLEVGVKEEGDDRSGGTADKEGGESWPPLAGGGAGGVPASGGAQQVGVPDASAMGGAHMPICRAEQIFLLLL